MKAKNHILVTGADGMGKTTLINQLTTTYKIPYIGHEGAQVTSQEDGLCRLASTRAKYFGIQDRCCAIDDPVYSEAFNRELNIPVLEYNKILQEWNPVIIFVRTRNPKISTEEKPHKSKELLEGVIEKSDTIQGLYVERMDELWDLGLMIHDYNWVFDPKAEELILKLTQAGSIC